MKVYYLQNLDSGWDNVICIALSPQKCIEKYTGGEIILETEDEVNQHLKENKHLYIDFKYIYE
jgi:hypothetical protein